MTDNNNANDDDEVKLHFDKTVTTADHRNMNASGDDHPMGDNPMDWKVDDMKMLVSELADDMYSSWEATVREYLANAETACRRVERALDDDVDSIFDGDELIVDEPYEPRIDVTWNKQENRLTIKDNGIGMSGIEVDEIYRTIARSAASSEGVDSGNFGMGALSFVQMEGEDDSMLLVTHSRQNDDNFAANVSIAGPEPVMGRLGGEEYGTKFELTPKDDNWNIRRAVDEYAEFLRVTVRYEEIDENGEEVFNEDYGGKTLNDEFDEEEVMVRSEEEGAYTAIASPNASDKTLLLAMPIERGGDINIEKMDCPVDVQIHDESGKVFTGPNAGKVPISRSEYDARCIEQTDEVIGENALDRTDVIGQTVNAGPNEGATVLSDGDYDQRFPSGNTDEYVPMRDITEQDVPGERTVIEGEHVGREVVSSDEWRDMTADMLDRFVPEDELTNDDVCLPKPKSDRDTLQQNDDFWAYVEQDINESVTEIVDAVKEFVEDHDNPKERFRELDEAKVRELVP